jgi:hypothetical protein
MPKLPAILTLVSESRILAQTTMTMTASTRVVVRVNKTVWVRVLLMIALATAGTLLLSNLLSLPDRLHGYLSSLPLAIAGIGYAILQFRIRPPRGTLLKRLLLAATFVTWAVDQLMPPGRLAMFISDAVIAAYVLDLYWLIQEQTSTVSSQTAQHDQGRMQA